MLYEIFYPNNKLPLFLGKIEDNDILKDPPNYDDSKYFYAAIQVKYQNYMDMDLHNNNFDIWLKLFDDNYINELIILGKNYFEYKNFIINNNNKDNYEIYICIQL